MTDFVVRSVCQNECPPLYGDPCDVPLDPSNNFTFTLLEGLLGEVWQLSYWCIACLGWGTNLLVRKRIGDWWSARARPLLWRLLAFGRWRSSDRMLVLIVNRPYHSLLKLIRYTMQVCFAWNSAVSAREQLDIRWGEYDESHERDIVSFDSMTTSSSMLIMCREHTTSLLVTNAALLTGRFGYIREIQIDI